MLSALPPRRTNDFEETTVTVTSSGGFLLRRVFYTAPSRLIGHPLRVRRYDDRLALFIGATPLLTLPRGRRHANGKTWYIVDYHHVISSLRRKPMALLNLVYREQLFPREAYRRTFDRLLDETNERQACRMLVKLLALAHDRGCEAELAQRLTQGLDQRQLPDLQALQQRFAPDPQALPTVTVKLGSLNDYNALLLGTGARP